MSRKQMLAILTGWGVKVKNDATDEELIALLQAGPPTAEVEDLTEEDEEEELAAASPGVLARLKKLGARVRSLSADRDVQARRNVEAEIDKLIVNDQVPVAQRDQWINDCVFDATLLARLQALPSRPPGHTPLRITVGDSSSIADINNAVEKHTAPLQHWFRNRSGRDIVTRTQIGNGSKELGNLIAGLKKFDTGEAPIGGLPVMGGPIRKMWDDWASGSGNVMNANTMNANLLRQVILSEVMRAFRRRLVSLEVFSHTYQNVPLEGTDLVAVPYYPLDTVASSDFVQANGYQIAPNAQTLSKTVTVGGAGPAQKVAGVGRKYKGLQFSAYEIRRQPWLDIAKLTVMAGEQLALDVLNDIINANILRANFGNSVFAGPPEAFDHNTVALKLQVAAARADWPEPGRNMVLTTEYYASLAADPYVHAFLNIGSTDVIRGARIGGLYGFENTYQNPRIPLTDDGNLVGWISWPSAVLVATAPIMPAPGEMLRLVSYDLVTDPQTGLSFSYKYWGDPMVSGDYEIIECCYGSGLGELAALKRITSNGN